MPSIFLSDYVFKTGDMKTNGVISLDRQNLPRFVSRSVLKNWNLAGPNDLNHHDKTIRCTCTHMYFCCCCGLRGPEAAGSNLTCGVMLFL